MSTQPALFGELLPTLSGCTNGVVSIDGKKTTLQCQDCGALETPEILVLMKFKFIRCTNDPEPVRRCPDCTTKHLDACDYAGHNRDRSRR
ncbi:hypothetical protein [Glutamicibacter sp.]|uniref:hypothetical protein n=1 Tax=Glutamicibacter sp. TaxID=1931995 RepID=UPI002FE09AEF